MNRSNTCPPVPGSATPGALLRPPLASWVLMLLLACTGGNAFAAAIASIEIKSAEWDPERDRLRVEVAVDGKGQKTVLLFDDGSNELLAKSRTRDSGLQIVVSGLTGERAPCVVRAESGGFFDTAAVANRPASCDSPPPPQNRAPECRIVTPDSDVAILLGDSVYFAGEATDPDGDPLGLEWDFGGGADTRPTVAVPGEVRFDQDNGRFVATFIGTDPAGLRCTDQVTVDVGTPPVDLPPKVTEQPAPGSPAAGDGQHAVLAFNDLGMHCADLGSWPFSVLPPFNTVNAQVVRKGTTGAGRPRVLDDGQVALRYSAASNPNDPVGPGSINSTSQNFPPGADAASAQVRKSDFWDLFDGANTIAALLFPGLDPQPDEGLQTVANADHGRYMPGIDDPYHANAPQDFSRYDPGHGWFTAQGIPITAVDDSGRPNSYPLMRVQALDAGTGEVLATTDAVVPVSAEVDCRDCHALGAVGADPAARAIGPLFVAAASGDRVDVETAAKHNILALHDFKHGTTFGVDGQPVLCASCHRSNALAEVGGPGGDPTLDNMSAVMHGFHGRLQVDAVGELVRDAAGEPVLIEPAVMTGDERPLIPVGAGVPMEQNCFSCHPGKITQCFRGAMFTAGQKCDDCHGDMLAMGAEFELADGGYREPWVDEPKCSACHGGYGDQLVGAVAYDPADPAATPLEVATSRFAENPGTLYRNSLDGHAGLACEACHGSPHAIWPNRNPVANDNVTAIQLQGHAGTLSDCTVCHEPGSFAGGTLGGPHGMHPVNDPDWIKGREDGYHEDYVWRDGEDQCAACHGTDHRGTRLSRVPVDRVLKDSEGKVRATLAAGEQVACDLCHSLEKSFDR
ncbi:MAG: hypothetical protein R3233_01900 [Xanthomonadales bacterium]|nr:hypothetical protein [Xanthomonadales bacterium]